MPQHPHLCITSSPSSSPSHITDTHVTPTLTFTPPYPHPPPSKHPYPPLSDNSLAPSIPLPPLTLRTVFHWTFAPPGISLLAGTLFWHSLSRIRATSHPHPPPLTLISPSYNAPPPPSTYSPSLFLIVAEVGGTLGLMLYNPHAMPSKPLLQV